MPIEAWLVARLGWRAALVTLAAVLAVLTIGGYPRVFGLLAVSLVLAGSGLMMTRRRVR